MNFIQAFETACAKKGKDYVEIYRQAEIDRRYYWRIKKKYSNPDYDIERIRAILLCMALQLPLEEFQNLLGYAGYALSPHRTDDLIVMDMIARKNYIINDLQHELYDAGFKI